MFMENGDNENAEKMAEQIAKCDFPVLSSEIFIKTGNIKRAREILVPHAEELCQAGMHISAEDATRMWTCSRNTALN
jgi:hypothetical protein